MQITLQWYHLHIVTLLTPSFCYDIFLYMHDQFVIEIWNGHCAFARLDFRIQNKHWGQGAFTRLSTLKQTFGQCTSHDSRLQNKHWVYIVYQSMKLGHICLLRGFLSIIVIYLRNFDLVILSTVDSAIGKRQLHITRHHLANVSETLHTVSTIPILHKPWWGLVGTYISLSY